MNDESHRRECITTYIAIVYQHTCRNTSNRKIPHCRNTSNRKITERGRIDIPNKQIHHLPKLQ